MNVWTPELEALYGLPPGGFGRTEAAWEQLIHPDDRAQALCLVEKAFETGEPTEGQWRVTWPDGSVHWLAGRWQVLKDESGKPLRMTGVNIDITERKAAEAELVQHREHLEELVQDRTGQLAAANVSLQEQREELAAQAEALRQSEQRLSLAQQVAHVGTFDLDLRTGVNVWTPELEAMYGLPPEGFGKTRLAWEQLVHPEDRAEAMRLVEQSLDTGEPTEGQWRVVWPDGSIHWLAGRWQVFKDESGKPYRMTGVNIDVTERKQVEEALRESQVALQRSHDELGQHMEARTADLDAMTRLQKLGTLFVREGNLDAALGEIVEAAIAVSGADFGNIQMLDPESSELKIVAQRGFSEWWLDFWNHVGEGQGACGTALRRGERVIVEDVEQSPIFVGTPALDMQLKAGVRAIQSTILVSRSGKRLGMLSTHFKTPHRPDDRVLRLLDLLAVQAVEIIERAQTEEALRRNERQFKSTFENAAIGIAHVALDGHILQCNSRFCEIAGYLPDEILGKTCEQITFAEDWQMEKEQLGRLLDSEVAHYSIEKRYIRMDGSPVWVNLTRSIQHDDTGKPEYFIILVEDISERKYAEEALRASEYRFRKLFEANLAGVYITKLDGTILDFNDAMMRMLGYDSREEVFQRKSTDFFADPEFRKVLLYLLHRDGFVPAKEAVLQRKDGSVLYALGAGALLVNEQTGEPYIQGVALDITERKLAEEALRELTRTLESRVAERTAQLEWRARQLQKLTLEVSEAEDRERKRMAEILHDDLQQQLAAAKFHLGLMKSRARYDASVQATAAQIDHMLMEAIKISRGLSHELSPAVMHHTDFADTLRWLAHQVQAKHGLVVHVHAHGEVRSQSDAMKGFLYKAVQELLFNVVKHARVNEANIRVRQCNGHICLRVSDRGRGFDPQELREAHGFGLLNIRERIELLGGRMKIRSAAGKGSTFFIVAPVREPAAESLLPDVKAAEPEAGEAPAESRLRVLLADDHEIVRQGLVSLLSEEHTVEIVGEAANGREAVELADRLHPDVVIMDVSMPLIDGNAATRQIKALRPETRVIALSMYDEPEKMRMMQRAGAESYVLKTAPSEELLAAIRGQPAAA